MDHGQRQFSFFQIAPHGLAHHLLGSGEVQQVVLNLEGGADLEAELPHPARDGFARPGPGRPELTGQGDQGGGLAFDNVEVVRLGKIEPARGRHLEHLALADDRGDLPDAQGDGLVFERAAQVEGLGDEIVPQHHGRLVAAAFVDGVTAAAEVGLVEHIVVNEGRHVDHLDHRGDGDRRLGEPLAGQRGVGRQGREKGQGGAEHLAAVALDMGAELGDGPDGGGELVAEPGLDAAQPGRQDRRDGRGGRGGVQNGVHGVQTIRLDSPVRKCFRKY